MRKGEVPAPRAPSLHARLRSCTLYTSWIWIRSRRRLSFVFSPYTNENTPNERLDVLYVRVAPGGLLGVGLDAASVDVLYETRGKGTKGPHDWKKHWKIVLKAREMFGPMKVNCHLIVGLGPGIRLR